MAEENSKAKECFKEMVVSKLVYIMVKEESGKFRDA